MTTSGNIEQRISDLVHMLPPLDENVEQIVRAAAERQADPAALEQLICRDSGLCANLLLLANCACVAPEDRPQPIQSIRAALDVVGLDALAAVVGASYAWNTVEHTLEPLHRQWAEYIQHSREISQISALLAELAGMPIPEREMYSASGLTHDIGRVVIMVASHNNSASLLGTTAGDMMGIVSSEQAAYGLDHCQIGFRLFHRWGFSDVMQQGILRHHSPLVQGDFCFPGALIFLAHFVTMSDFTGDIIARMLPAELLRRLELRPADLDRARAMFLEQKRRECPA
jgi:HD-like signal output (HDOD) protein